MDDKKLVPFLKWPGGKRWFISKYRNLFPSEFNKYIEPFVGGGSIYFNLLPDNALIADINHDLINLYIIMRDNPGGLRESLLLHQENHCKEYYYIVRETVPCDATDKAGRFLYLNRTCFNGMYRVNQQGMFNVPIGTKDNCVYDIEMFETYSQALQKVEILISDFSSVIRRAEVGDFVFADPPYSIAHNQNSFIKYNERLFTWADQERLLEDLCQARVQGAVIFATNANYRLLRDMYIERGFYTTTIKRYSSISGRSDRRGMQEELLITSIPIVEG